jgi:hypothetical protein
MNPTVPQALSAVVRGFASLHDFRLRPLFRRSTLRPQTNLTNGAHALSPGDFAIIYDLVSTYASGIKGSGRSIAVIGRSDVQNVDINNFRSTFGLPAGVPTVILAGADPGLVTGDQTESDLDLEWAGGIASAATLKFVTAKSTGTTDGIVLSSQYAVNNKVAPIISVSYLSCEAQLGSAGNVRGSGRLRRHHAERHTTGRVQLQAGVVRQWRTGGRDHDAFVGEHHGALERQLDGQGCHERNAGQLHAHAERHGRRNHAYRAALAEHSDAEFYADAERHERGGHGGRLDTDHVFRLGAKRLQIQRKPVRERASLRRNRQLFAYEYHERERRQHFEVFRIRFGGNRPSHGDSHRVWRRGGEYAGHNCHRQAGTYVYVCCQRLQRDRG